MLLLRHHDTEKIICWTILSQEPSVYILLVLFHMYTRQARSFCLTKDPKGQWLTLELVVHTIQSPQTSRFLSHTVTSWTEAGAASAVAGAGKGRDRGDSHASFSVPSRKYHPTLPLPFHWPGPRHVVLLDHQGRRREGVGFGRSKWNIWSITLCDTQGPAI